MRSSGNEFRLILCDGIMDKHISTVRTDKREMEIPNDSTEHAKEHINEPGKLFKFSIKSLSIASKLSGITEICSGYSSRAIKLGAEMREAKLPNCPIKSFR